MRVHFFVKLFFESAEKSKKNTEVSDKYLKGFSEAFFPWIFLIFPNRSVVFFDVRRKIVGPIIF